MINFSVNDYSLLYVAWNIFLSLIPFLFCFALYKINRGRIKLHFFPSLILFFLWLIFLPNAPYIISDMRHINGFCPNTILDICPENNWMIFFFFIYSILGWIIYYYSMEQMISFLMNYTNKTILTYLPLILSPIVGIGLLLGLLNRFNSWDILIRPVHVLESSYYYISTEEGLINLISSSLSLALLYYLGKIIFKPLNKIKG